MRLVYSILWIEDSLEFVESILDDIKDHISDCGFVPNVEVLNSINDKNMTALNDKRYDLMLIDYQLASVGGGVIDNGKTVIQKIRDMKVYTNILFYSSNYEKIRDMAGLDGVFIRNRTILTRRKISELYGIIDFLMERGIDINVMRGIVMSEVAEIDMLIFDLIECLIRNKRKDLCCYVKEKAAEKYHAIESISEAKLWEKIASKGTRYLTSMDRCNFLFKRVLSGDKYDEIHKEIVELLQKRNKLAHTREESVEKVDCRGLRKSIIEIKGKIEKLKAELMGMTEIKI